MFLPFAELLSDRLKNTFNKLDRNIISENNIKIVNNYFLEGGQVATSFNTFCPYFEEKRRSTLSEFYE